MHRWFILVLVVAPSLSAQPAKVNAKQVETLEKRVAALEATFAERQSSLRKVYETLQEKLDLAMQRDGGARIEADLVRVLAPMFAEVRTAMETSGAAARRQAWQTFRGGVRTALEKVEEPPLEQLLPYIEARLFEEIPDIAGLQKINNTEDGALAKRLLTRVMDQSAPFYERWNTELFETGPGTKAFREAHENLERARTDLAVAKDPLLAYQIGCPPGYARVPAGTYAIVSEEGFNQKHRLRPRRVSLDQEVWIGLYEVTNAEYLEWLLLLSAEERKEHSPRDDDGKPLWPLDGQAGEPRPAPDRLQHPVVGINLRSACLYAASRNARLPTEAEWCAMAAGKDQLPYPWGREYVKELANDRELGRGDTMPVGQFPGGRGPFGHWDVAGNVGEWLLTDEDGRNVDPSNIESVTVAVRGGSFNEGPKSVQTTWVWLRRALFERNIYTGFRLARSPSISGK